MLMDVYEITSEKEELQGIGLRNKLKTIGEKHGIDVLPQNLPNNTVRFAVRPGTDVKPVIDFIKEFRPSSSIKRVNQ